MKRFRHLALLVGWALPLFRPDSAARAATTTSQPFHGVTLIQRTETAPRPLRINVVLIDLADPGVSFRLTPDNGPLPGDTTRQTTRQFLAEQGGQLAINAHFFDINQPEFTDDISLAASNGVAYSPFQNGFPALNIGADNVATIVRPVAGDPGGFATNPSVGLYNTVAGNEQIVTGGLNTAADFNLNPRTVIGTLPGNRLLLFTVDGRQPGVSEGMTTSEIADLLIGDYGVLDALNLDGGGSTTLAIADPFPRLLNTPVGLANIPGTERSNGTNLVVFAAVPEPTMWLIVLPALLVRRARRRELRSASIVQDPG